MICHICVRSSSTSSGSALARQFGFKRNNCLAVASLVRETLENNKEACVTTLDERNAFNSVSREAVIKSVSWRLSASIYNRLLDYVPFCDLTS